MKLKRKNPSFDLQDNVDIDELENEIPKRKMRKKKVIIESDSSSSEDEDDIPLSQRQNIKTMISKAKENIRKKSDFTLSQDKPSKVANNQKTSKPPVVDNSKRVSAPRKPKTNGTASDDGFKKPMMPPPLSNGGFKAPLPPQNGEFAAPMPMLSQGQQSNCKF
jgi:hypothetical protein